MNYPMIEFYKQNVKKIEEISKNKGNPLNYLCCNIISLVNMLKTLPDECSLALFSESCMELKKRLNEGSEQQ